MLQNAVTTLLNVKYPIIQAPMAGGITTAELVAAVTASGGLGMIGAGYMAPDRIQEQAKEIKKCTDGTFGINLFVPNEFEITEEELNTANQLLKPFREHLNVKEEKVEIPVYQQVVEAFNQQLAMVIDEKIPVCSFTFGIPPNEVIKELKSNGIIVIGTATTVREAIEIENSGMDMVVVQGSEAGGHRGDFSDGGQESMVGLMSLIPQAADHVNIPVIAAGGIMDGRGVMASLCLGAKAVQMGTAFLTCTESGANKLHKEEVLHAHEDEVVLTRAFSGRWARGVHNNFTSAMEKHQSSVPGFPVQNSLTKEIRSASAAQSNREFMSLWSGQSPRLAKSQTAKSLIQSIIREVEALK